MERNKALWGMIFLMVMVLLPSISAFGESISIDERLKTDLTISPSAIKYPAISIKGFWDFMPLVKDTKADLVLTEHSETCGIDCLSQFQIKTYSESSLIDDVKFYRLDEGKREERNIRGFQFQYWGDVIDYKTECSPAKLTEEEIKNETKPYDICVQVESGKHKDFISYNMGDVLPAGTYDIKLLGQKAPYMSIDWVIKTQGKMITEWATWGNISTGSQAEVILNSPANGSTQYTNLINYNASFNITTLAQATNATLYTSINSGAWTIANTTVISSGTVTGETSYYPLLTNSNSATSSTYNGADTNMAYSGISAWFNGASSFVQLNNLGNALSGATSFTFATWIYLNETLGTHTLFHQGIYTNGQAEFLMIDGGVLKFYSLGYPGTTICDTPNAWTDISGGQGLSAGQWYHVVLSQNTSGNYAWINGVFKQKLNCVTTGTYQVGDTNLKIGKVSTGCCGDSNFLNGSMKDTYFFKNKVLSESEIQTLYYKRTGEVLFSNTYPSSSNIKWNYRLCDSDGACGFAPQNFTFSIDGTAPSITLNYPTSLIDYGKLNGTLQLNFTATDSNLDYCGFGYYTTSNKIFQGYGNIYQNHTNFSLIAQLHRVVSGGDPQLRYTITIPANCKNNGKITLYDDGTNVSCIDTGGANVTLTPSVGGYGLLTKFFEVTPCSSGVPIVKNITLSQNKVAEFYANDTAGNLNTTTFSWDYTFFETSRTFNSSTFTTAEEPFTLNITTDGSQIPIAYLVYNGTSYLSTRTGNLTNPMFSNSITMTNVGNMSFYWSILWGSQVINTSTSYQQVTAVTAMNITSSACSAGLTKVANFTFANEVNFTALTGATVNYNFKYGIANSTGLVSAGTLTNVSVFNVCLNLTQSANYTIGYGEVQYSNDGYSDRRFYLFENTRYSNNTITNVLYSLPNANSYSFLFEARTPALNVYSDKYVSLLRWYPNINDYKIVEMGNTDQKGQTVFKVKTEDVDYRIGIYERDGTLIYLANPIRMVCLVSPCSYTLTVRTTEGYSYDNRLQVQNSLTYNNGTFTFTYNDPSQATDLMRLVVYSMSGTDETQICEDNSTSFTAILSCNVSSTTGVLKAVAYRTASPEFPLATLIVDTLTTIFQGTFGLFLQFLLTTTLILAGLISPVVAIILGILSLLIGVLVFKTISISIAIGIGILGAIVIHFIKRQGTI